MDSKYTECPNSYMYILKRNKIFGRNVKPISTRLPKNYEIYQYNIPNPENNTETESDINNNKTTENNKIGTINEQSQQTYKQWKWSTSNKAEKEGT